MAIRTTSSAARSSSYSKPSVPKSPHRLNVRVRPKEQAHRHRAGRPLPHQGAIHLLILRQRQSRQHQRLQQQRQARLQRVQRQNIQYRKIQQQRRAQYQTRRLKLQMQRRTQSQKQAVQRPLQKLSQPQLQVKQNVTRLHPLQKQKSRTIYPNLKNKRTNTTHIMDMVHSSLNYMKKTRIEKT